jgi:nicotinamidase-related amidase
MERRLSMLGPDITRSALIIVDMQNDFLHPDGGFAARARAKPGRVDMEFLQGTIAPTKQLAEAFRAAKRPVVYITHVVKPDFSDGQWPWWRLGHQPGGNRAFVAEGSWGAKIVDDLAPREGEHVVVKKGFGGFSNTPLDTILRNFDVTTAVVCGVTTCVCVSTTLRGGVEHNYRMILARDAVAEVDRQTHEAELRTIARVFGDVKSNDEIVAMLAEIRN